MKTVATFKPILAVLAALALGACGGEESETASESGSQTGAPTDLAFAAQMAEHHEGAIDMAQLAERRARHPEVRALAEDIATSQRSEIGVLEQASTRLQQEGTEAADLGLSAHMSGMDHDAAALEGAKPFDRAFIDAMIPHHQGAIRMARIELEKGADGELKALAEDIVESQSREIEQMNEWRREWYGKPSPAGGVPAADDRGAEPEEDPHSGH